MLPLKGCKIIRCASDSFFLLQFQDVGHWVHQILRYLFLQFWPEHSIPFPMLFHLNADFCVRSRWGFMSGSIFMGCARWADMLSSIDTHIMYKGCCIHHESSISVSIPKNVQTQVMDQPYHSTWFWNDGPSASWVITISWFYNKLFMELGSGMTGFTIIIQSHPVKQNLIMIKSAIVFWMKHAIIFGW